MISRIIIELVQLAWLSHRDCITVTTCQWSVTLLPVLPRHGHGVAKTSEAPAWSIMMTTNVKLKYMTSPGFGKLPKVRHIIPYQDAAAHHWPGHDHWHDGSAARRNGTVTLVTAVSLAG